MMKNDLKYMSIAFLEAKKAYEINEVPVGCVIVYNDKIVAKKHNMRHNLKCSLYHAEILAIKEACENLDRWILDDCTMYVTLEPCLMCTGAIIQSRIKRVVYGASEDRFGCFDDALNYFDSHQNHHVETKKGIMKEEIEALMKDFFKNLRENKN